MRLTAPMTSIALLVAALAPLQAAVPVTTLAYSPDGRALVSNGDRGLDVRSPVDAVVQRRISSDLPRITQIAFLPGGDRLVVGGGEPGVQGEVRVLAWPDGRELHRLGGFTDIVTGVATRADTNGVLVAACSADWSGRVWRLAAEANAEPALRFVLTGHAGPVLGIAFSPSNPAVLVTGSADRSVKVWSPGDGRRLRSFSQHTEPVHAIAFRPDFGGGASSPASCATGSDDRTVRVWLPETGRMVRIVRRHEGPVLALAWSRDGRALYSAGREGIIRRIEGGSDAIENEWRAHGDWIYSLAVSPNGAQLASGDWSGAVRLHPLSR